MRLRRAAPPEPVLSIVVPVYQVEEYLDACLTSLREQDLEAVEIVVVDDGSTDGSAKIAQRHARKDPRVRAVTRENGGLSAARNTGIEHATAPYLTFVDSDDLVLAPGFARAVASLETSGADYALLPYRQLHGTVPQPVPAWVADLYGDDDRTVVAAEHPEVLAQATAWSKVYRRTFWDAHDLAFRDGALYEDQEVTARAFAAADRIDLVPEPTYLWRIRPGSITRESTERSIGGFLESVVHALDALPEPARAARVQQLLTHDMPRYLRSLRKVDDAGFRSRLLIGVAALLEEPGVDLTDVAAEARAVYDLVRGGRATEVEAFVADGGLDLASLRGVEVDGEPALQFPTGPYVLSPVQTPIDAWIMRAWIERGRAELTVLAYLRHLEGAPSSARAWWVSSTGERLAELTVVHAPELVGHRWRTTRAGNEQASWRVSGPLPDGAGPVGVEVEVTHRGRTDSTVVTLLDPSGSAAIASSNDGWVWSGVELRRGTGKPVEDWRHLPIDQRDGWLALDDRGFIAHHDLPADVPREQLTVWWQRDHAD